MPKHTKFERNRTHHHIRIYHWELTCPAFRALTVNEVRVYLEMRSRYNGQNNGRISFSSREAGAVCHKANSTGARALQRLTDLGFIKIHSDSTFAQKRLAREYELTAISMDPARKSDKLPPGAKDFLKMKYNSIKALGQQNLNMKNC